MRQISNTKIKKISELLLNSIFLFITAWWVLPLHKYTIFTWLDGQYIKHLVEQQSNWAGYSSFGMNFFQGLGDISFPILYNLVPAYVLANFLSTSANLDFSILAYAFFSVQYFIAAYLLCRVFKLTHNVSLIAAWLITIFAFPFLPIYNGQPLLYVIVSLCPDIANFLFFCSILIYAFSFLGKLNRLSNLILGAFILLVALYTALYSSVSVILAIPFIAICYSSLIIFSNNKKERFIKIAFLIIGLLLFIILKYPQFILGLFLYSVPTFFPKTLTTYPSINYTSIIMLFREHVFIAGFYIGILGFIGTIKTIMSKTESENKKYAAIFLLYISLVFLLGIFAWLFPDKYYGPYSLYYEYIVWPLYMGYAVKLIYSVLEKIISYTSTSFSGTPFFQKSKMSSAGYLANKVQIIFIPIIIGTIITLINISIRDPQPTFFFSKAMTPPPIINYLRTELALSSTRPFKGSVAVFAPAVSTGRNNGWIDQITFDATVILPKLHYSYRDSLWFHNIPTLLEYNQILSPALYLLSIKTLAHSTDKQIRNIIAYTRINIPLLQALGVSYIITNELINKSQTKLIMSQHIDDEYGQLYLYKISSSNLGTYSPNKFLPLQNVNIFFKTIKRQGIDFSHEAYVTEGVPKITSTAKNVVITPIRNGIHLTAQASGTSTILLPILYSRCLHVEFIGKKPMLFQLQRANLIESLITFHDRINLNITYQYGLLNNASCRLKDRKELKAILKDL